MRVVTPFRPFPPASIWHLELGPFDWHGAIEMLRASVRQSCGCQTFGLTDPDTTLPGPTIHVPTEERQYLMLWILEVARAYLESDYFDKDTVFCSPDILVLGDLRPWFAGDVGIVIRPDHDERPIINSVQWWPVASKDKLIALYRDAERLARKLPEDLRVWGADSEPFRRLLSPMRSGIGYRRKAGLVANLIDSRDVMTALSTAMIDGLDRGEALRPDVPIVDFRVFRKRHMRRYFEAVMGVPA